MIVTALTAVADGHSLSQEEAREVMGVVMRGEATQAQIGGLLIGLRARGETVDEITGFAEALREHVLPVTPSRTPVVDVVGTGGDGAETFNISTAAAVVAARERTWAPVASAMAGVRGIFTDYAGSTFLAPRDPAEPRDVGSAVPARR